MPSGSNDNRYSIFEEEDEDADDEDYEIIDVILPIDKKKPAFCYDAEDLGEEDIDEIIYKCNIKHPPGKRIEYVCELEEELKEKEYEIEHKNHRFSVLKPCVS